MSEIFRSIGILIVLLFSSSFVGALPDYVGGAETVFGAVEGHLFYVFFGIVPIVILLLLDLQLISVYSLPFSDTLDMWMDYVLYISVMITSFVLPHTVSALTSAFSFIMTVFILLFPLHLFYTDIVRFKLQVKNRFLSDYLPLVVFGGLIVLSIVFAYVLGPQGIYLPGDLLLSFGTYTIMDIAVPNLYFLSVGGVVLYWLYEFIFDHVISRFIPKHSYNNQGNGRSHKRG